MFVGEREIGQIKGMIRDMWMILLNTVQLVILMFVQNFEILSQVVHEKS